MLVAWSEFMGGQVAPGEAAWAEDRGRLFERYFQPLQQLTHGWLVGREQARRLSLQFQVQIADRPADAGRGGRRHLERYLHDGLGLLLQNVPRARGLPEHLTMLQWPLELETKFGAIVRSAPPEALGH